MATVTGLTADRMLAIEAASVVDGDIVGNNLILTKHDGSTVDAGNVRGPTGPTGPAGDVSIVSLAAAILNALPVGMIVDYIEIAPPTNWLALDGSTVVGGQSTYPLLWAKLPGSMKSGANIILPDTRGKVTVGYNSANTAYDAIGETGGAETQALTQGQLPAAGISVDPPATLVSIDPPATNISIAQGAFNVTANPPTNSFTVDPPSTTVSINPPSVTSGGQSASHTHSYVHPGGDTWVGVPSGTVQTAAAGVGEYATSTGGASVGHTHTIDIPSFNATVNIAPWTEYIDIDPFTINVDPPTVTATVDILAFNATVNIAAFTSGNLGSGEAHNNMQPYIVMLKIIKAA